MNKTILSLLAAVLVLGAATAEAITVTLNPSDTTPMVGDTITMDVAPPSRRPGHRPRNLRASQRGSRSGAARWSGAG